MPRISSEETKQKKAEAESLFRKGTALTDIAKTLKIPEGTIRSWKNRGGWDKDVKKTDCNVAKTNATEKRCKKQTQRKSVALQKKSKAKEDICKAEVESVCENEELTDKQRLFCLYYVRCFNATKAYKKAYECSYETAMVEGCKTLRNPKIKNEILRLKQERMNRELLSEEDIFQKYMDIAFADMTEYTDFGTREITVINKSTGKTEKITVSYVDVKDSKAVDGTLITEITNGRDGVKVKLADRMQALKWLSDHMDLATEEQRARITALRAKTETDDGNDVVDDWMAALLEVEGDANDDNEG
jgi:phage terminase small subunit